MLYWLSLSEILFNPIFFGLASFFFLFLCFPLILLDPFMKMTSFSNSFFKTLIYFNICGLTDFFPSFCSETPFSFISGSLIWMTVFFIWLVYYLDSLMNILFNKNLPPLAASGLVSLELISLMARAISLGLRLTANIIAGKLLGHTLFSLALSSSILPSIFFFHLETAVAVLQAYVFFTLSILYWKEMINH